MGQGDSQPNVLWQVVTCYPRLSFSTTSSLLSTLITHAANLPILQTCLPGASSRSSQSDRRSSRDNEPLLQTTLGHEQRDLCESLLSFDLHTTGKNLGRRRVPEARDNERK